MQFDPDKHHRRSIRLKRYDYAQAGSYFVTVCTHDRQCLFGDVVDGHMMLNEAGRLVQQTWQQLPARFPSVALDSFVVMPNHVHGVIVIIGTGLTSPGIGQGAAHVPGRGEDQGAASSAPTVQGGSPVGAGLALPGVARGAAGKGAASSAPTLGDVMRAFKSVSAIQVNQSLLRSGQPLWLRNYYEHIVRNYDELDRIRQYILVNPSNWTEDPEHPRHPQQARA